MSTRTSLLALATLTAIGLAALTPTTASAWGFHRGYHGGHFHLGRVGFVHRGFYRWGGYHRPYWWAGYRGWRWYHRPYVYGAVGGAALAAAPAAAAAQPSCLVKQYLPNGAVAFQDTCTNESAIAPAAGPQPQGPTGPTAQ